MPFDSDVALLGTGVAPLIAANYLLAQGKSVVLLNPDYDFFLEDSELPLDPLIPLDPARLKQSQLEAALRQLRPQFPGAVELWRPDLAPAGFHDLEAPHVRERSRIWIAENERDLERFEDAFVRGLDAGLNPQLLEGMQAARKFPGFSTQPAHLEQFKGRALVVPKLCDVDVARYRNGLLEFVRERLGPDRVVCSAAQIELMPGGVRFHARGSANTARLAQGMLVFWTPRLTSWVLAQAKKAELDIRDELPRGVRVWEHWSLVSREPIDPAFVGVLNDLIVWADAEGIPSDRITTLAVLRFGELLSLQQHAESFASADSFNALSSLCDGFLKWNRFSIRSMRPRMIFEWDRVPAQWPLGAAGQDEARVQVVSACDGPLFEVVKQAREASDALVGEA